MTNTSETIPPQQRSGGRWITLGFLGLMVCFLTSGTTALLYEIVWSRYLSLFLGSTTYAHTAVLAVFMGGLGLGNHLFGPIADRSRDPMALYGWAELAIGVYALLFPIFFPLLSKLYLLIGGALGPESLWILPLKFTLGAVSILFPTVIMGGTLPMLSRALVQKEGDIGHRVGFLYFINTAGAVLGCFLGGFWCIEHLGLSGSMLAAAIANIAIGIAVIGIRTMLPNADAWSETQTSPTLNSSQPMYTPRQVQAVVIAIGFSGALAMLYELVWIRLVAFVFGSSSQSFSVMLMTFIAGLALGGFVVSIWLRRPERAKSALRLIAFAEIGIGLTVMGILPAYERFPYIFARVRSAVAPTADGFVLMQGLQIGLLFMLMLIPTTLLGITLPLASRVAIRSVDSVGSGVGRVFSSNTFGAICGVVVTGLVLIPWLELQTTLMLGIFANLVIGIWLLNIAGVQRSRTTIMAVVMLVIFGVGALWIGPWDPVLMTAGYFRRKAAPESFEAMRKAFADHRLLYTQDGLDTTVTVVEVDDSLFLKVNGKTDASTLRGDMVTQVISGHLPMLLHPGDPQNALIIGLGSGVTAGSVLHYPNTKARIVEISEAVAEGARHFAQSNNHVHDNPDANMIIGDARDYLLLDRDTRYDVIISEPSNPWIAGVANLFTEEFFKAVIERLNPDGLYVQWLQVYSINDVAFAGTLRTLRSVFPWVTVWRFNRADALMVASPTPLNLDLEKLRARLALPDVHAALTKADAPVPIHAPADLLIHQALSATTVTAHFSGRGPRNSDAHPYLEFEAPRAMFRRQRLTLLDTLDDRHDPRKRPTLLLGTLGSTPLPQPDLERLAALLEANNHRKLAKTLAKASAKPTQRSRLLAEGDLDRLAASEAIDALGESPDQANCRVYITRAASYARQQISVVSGPDPSVIEQMVELCAQTHPELELEIRLVLAALYYNNAQAELAWREAQKALEAKDNSALPNTKELQMEALYIVARGSSEVNRLREAKNAYERLLLLDPNNKEARLMLGK